MLVSLRLLSKSLVFGSLLLASAFFVLAADSSVLTFSGGAGDDSVDGFPGYSDEIWSSEWTTTVERGTLETEILGEGEERGLRVVYECTETVPGGQASRIRVRRSLDPSRSTVPHVIETTVRFSEDMARWAPVGDFWGLGASTISFSRVNSTHNISWFVMASVSGWKVWTKEGGKERWQDLSEEPLLPGVDYKIRVEVNPPKGLWSVELSHGEVKESLKDIAMATTAEPDGSPATHGVLTYYCSLNEPQGRAVFTIKSLAYSPQPSEP